MGTMRESCYGEQECNDADVVNHWHLEGVANETKIHANNIFEHLKCKGHMFSTVNNLK